MYIIVTMCVTNKDMRCFGWRQRKSNTKTRFELRFMYISIDLCTYLYDKMSCVVPPFDLTQTPTDFGTLEVLFSYAVRVLLLLL